MRAYYIIFVAIERKVVDWMKNECIFFYECCVEIDLNLD